MWWLVPWLLFIAGVAAVLGVHSFRGGDGKPSRRRRV